MLSTVSSGHTEAGAAIPLTYMIGQLVGKIIAKSPELMTLDVGGTGYEVRISLNSYYELPPPDSSCILKIHTYVREDQITLFGFLTEEERQLFRQLIRISGVGPKLAMTLLSGLSWADLVEAIVSEETHTLQALPGIGRKTAERIIVELKDRLKRSKPTASPTTNGSKLYDEVLSALTNLGYNKAQAEKALADISWQQGLKIEEAIKVALKNLVRL